MPLPVDSDGSRVDLTETLKAEAQRLGFDQVGIAPAIEPPDYGRLAEWLARNDHAGMSYMERQLPARAHPGHLLEGVQSVVMVSLVYGRDQDVALDPTQARIAQYAQGRDYHEVLWERLESLLAFLRTLDPTIRGRAVADSAPLLERDFARRAGLGWVGKNTMLINRRLGSYTVLGALLLDRELRFDEPHESAHCGTCTRCLDACPTDAFRGPYQLDANRCISYWTIEHKGDLPDIIAASLGDWVFGCDVCQEVCPWNRKAPRASDSEMAPNPAWNNPDLLDWLAQDSQSFAKSLKGTALSRTKRRGLIRNALHLLGNRRIVEAEPEVVRLLDDPEPVIQRAARWALDRIRMVRGAEPSP